MNWSNVCCMFGIELAWHAPLTMQLTSGVDVFARVCGQEADTSSNYCDITQPYDKMRFSFCQMWHDFFNFFGKLPQIWTNFLKAVRQRCVCGGMVRSIIWFRWEFSSLPAVREFWKSVKNWQNYYHEFGVLLFGTQCRRLRSTYCTTEATDKHEASRVLSATAGLLVYLKPECLSRERLESIWLRKQNQR